jgi:hypothetical protein
MVTQVTMELPIAPKTNTLSAAAMDEAGIPNGIRFEIGNFDARLTDADFDVSGPVYEATEVVLAASALTKDDMLRQPASGEIGLSHVLFQQLVAPANRILNAIGVQGQWSVKGRGTTPIPDLVFMRETLAVLELKTIHSMPNVIASTIMEHIEDENFTTGESWDPRQGKIFRPCFWKAMRHGSVPADTRRYGY